jgi:hypothetical protein
MPDALRLQGYDELLRKLDSLAKLRRVEGALKAAGAHLSGKLKRYPAQKRMTRASMYGQPFKSDRQRKYFFYALRKGLIQVPYRRGQSPGSRNLKQQWTVETYNSGLTVEVGNATPYGPYVQGHGRQALYHYLGGWKTEWDVMSEEGEQVLGFVKRAVDETLAED